MAACIEVPGFEGFDEPAKSGLVRLTQLRVGREGEVSDEVHGKNQHYHRLLVSGEEGSSQQASHETEQHLCWEKEVEARPWQQHPLAVDVSNGRPHHRHVDSGVRNGSGGTGNRDVDESPGSWRC